MQEELRCDKCHKTNVRFRIKLNNYICNTCGNVWEKADNKEIVKELKGNIKKE